MSKHSVHRPRLLTAGYVTLDVIVRDIEEGDYWHAAGGTCGNVSVFASALGADVSVLARVGEDQRGLRLLGSLVTAGVDTTRIKRIATLRTPGIVELVNGGGDGKHRFAFRCPVCGSRLPQAAVVSKRQAEVEAKYVDEFAVFFFDRATSSTVHLAEVARQAGLLIVFEPNSTPKTALAERAASLSDIVKVSQRSENRRETWRLTKGASTQFFVETLGGQGARVRTRSGEGWGSSQELPPTRQSCIRDTAGAGDWLTAGLIMSLIQQGDTLDEDTIREAIRYGQRLSAISLAFDGPGGALTALGAHVIESIARSNSPIEMPPSQCRTTQAQSDQKLLLPAGFCELCLSDTSSSRQE